MATPTRRRSTPAKPPEKALKSRLKRVDKALDAGQPKDVVETRHVLRLDDHEQAGFQKETKELQAVRTKLEEIARAQQMVPQLQQEYANREGRIQGRAQLALERRGIDPDEANWSMTINEDRISITYMAPHGAPPPEAQEAEA